MHHQAIKLGLLFLFAVSVDAKKKSMKDWSSIDFDKVEEDWQGGDSEMELTTEDEKLYHEMEKRREQTLDVDGPLDPEAVRHQESNAGPAMMFIELRKKDSGYGETELVDLGGVWRDLLFSGGLDVKFYNIEENRMLVSLQKGWDSKDVKDFLLEQKEVAKVTWDSIDYTPDDPEKDLTRSRAANEAQQIKKKNPKSKTKKTKKKTKKKTIAA